MTTLDDVATFIAYEIWQRKFAGANDYELKWGPFVKVWEGSVECPPDRETRLPDFRQALESLFTIFNLAHPAGFTGHSLSVGDRVVLGKETTWKCASVGWESVSHPSTEPSFTDNSRS
jgi:hypothetical protein